MFTFSILIGIIGVCVLRMSDLFHFKSGTTSGFKFNLVFLPNWLKVGIWDITLSAGSTYFTSVMCTKCGFQPSQGITCTWFPLNDTIL